MNKPIMYYHVNTSNRGDWAIKKSITDAINKRINNPLSYFNVKTDELTKDRITKQLNTNCCALIIAGSGLYTNYPKSSGWYFPCKTELFDLIKVPIFLIGIGNNKNLKGKILNTKLKKETKRSIKKINNLAYISTVRDQRTYNLLYDIGINKHELQLDPANFLELPSKNSNKKLYVAINIAQHAPILGRFDGGIEGQQNRQKNINNLTNICKYLKEKYNLNSVFIAHDALEQSLAIDIKKNFSELEILNTDNLNVMLKAYSMCLFSIGMKMHSNIMSFSMGTPFISLYYDKKSVEYLKMIKCEELGINVFSDYYNVVKNKIDMLVKEYQLYTKKIIEVKKLNQQKFDKTFNKLCEIIKNSN